MEFTEEFLKSLKWKYENRYNFFYCAILEGENFIFFSLRLYKLLFLKRSILKVSINKNKNLEFEYSKNLYEFLIEKQDKENIEIIKKLNGGF